MRIKITMDAGGYNEWEMEDLVQITITTRIGGGWAPNSRSAGAPKRPMPVRWWEDDIW